MGMGLDAHGAAEPAGLRFVAAFSILLAHVMAPLHVNVFGLRIFLWSISFLGMPLFFVLRDFVIHYH